MVVNFGLLMFVKPFWSKNSTRIFAILLRILNMACTFRFLVSRKRWSIRLSICVWLLSVLSMGRGVAALDSRVIFLMTTSIPQRDSLLSFGVPTISATDSFVRSFNAMKLFGSVSFSRAIVCILPVLSRRIRNLILLRLRNSSTQPCNRTSLCTCFFRSLISVRFMHGLRIGGTFYGLWWGRGAFV